MKNRITCLDFKWKSEDIAGLQVADLIAYPLTRHVLNPQGVISLKKSGYDIFTVCLDFDQVTLMRRALNRGDSPVEITRRIMADAHSFDRMKLDGFIDLHITNPELLPQQIAEMIQNSI